MKPGRSARPAVLAPRCLASRRTVLRPRNATVYAPPRLQRFKSFIARGPANEFQGKAVLDLRKVQVLRAHVCVFLSSGQRRRHLCASREAKSRTKLYGLRTQEVTAMRAMQWGKHCVDHAMSGNGLFFFRVVGRSPALPQVIEPDRFTFSDSDKTGVGSRSGCCALSMQAIAD